MPSINITEALSIAKIIYGIAECDGNIEKYISQICNPDKEITTLLNDINNDLVNGFNKVATSINDTNLENQWKEYHHTLNQINTSLISYHSALSTVKHHKSGQFKGEYTIVYDNNTILFEDWCNGYTGTSGTIHPSRLDHMSSWVNTHNIDNDKYPSLVGMFTSTNSDGNNAIDLWVKIAISAQQSPNITNKGDTATTTAFNSLINFMDSISKLAKLAYYTHDTALELLNKILKSKNKPHSTRLSIRNNITKHFGSYNNKDTIWQQFAQELDNLASGTPDTQYKNAAFTPGLFPGSIGESTIRRSSDAAWTFYPGQTSISTSHPNCFITSLCLTEIKWEGFPQDFYYNNIHIALQAQIVQVAGSKNSSPEFNLLPGNHPSTDFYSTLPEWASYEAGLIVLNGGLKLGTYEPSYPTPPALSSNNAIQVITGFQLVSISNNGEFNIGIALQFGELDMTDPENPTVTVSDPSFILPDFTCQQPIQQFMNNSPIGNYSSPTGNIKSDIITNASFDRFWKGGIQGNSCLNAQMAPTFYKADFYQLDNLKEILTTSTS